MPSKRIPYFKPSKELKDLVNHSASADGASTGSSSTGLVPLHVPRRAARQHASWHESLAVSLSSEPGKPDGCIFCDKAAGDRDEAGLIVHRRS